MSFGLTVNGHLANPDEEAEIRDKAEAFVRELIADKDQAITYAVFNGSYTGFTFHGGQDAPYWERTGYDPLAENAKPIDVSNTDAPLADEDGGHRAD